MAITPVSSNYEGFIFGGVNSRTYGVYITDPAVFNAPKRDVDMISIPGRNGAFALDRGRFENIEVTYHCAMGAGNETDYLDAISDLRNILASKTGYVRLTDEINTTEYRMAVFKDGLDVSSLNKKTGTFDVKFEAKPQRFLTSGETKSAVANNGTVTNPTLFDASPLIEFNGYGTIGIGSYSIDVANVPMGNVVLFGEKSFLSSPGNATFNADLVNVGDAISVGTTTASFILTAPGEVVRIENATNLITQKISTYKVSASAQIPNSQFTFGTSSNRTVTFSADVVYMSGGVETTQSISGTYTLAYGAPKNFYFTLTVTPGALSYEIDIIKCRDGAIADSSKSALGNPLYIDLDIGEAYKIENSVVISSNAGVTLGGDLPVLVPGSNTITYPNTVTNFKLTPRWWKV